MLHLLQLQSVFLLTNLSQMYRSQGWSLWQQQGLGSLMPGVSTASWPPHNHWHATSARVQGISSFFSGKGSIIMRILGIDVIFSGYITLHNKVLVVLLYLNHSKLGEISLLMSWSLMKSMFLLVNIKLFPRWSTVLSSFISLLKVKVWTLQIQR